LSRRDLLARELTRARERTLALVNFEAAELFIREGITAVMNRFNRKEEQEDTE